MNSILEGSETFGHNGLKWWIGQVAPRETWSDRVALINDKDQARENGENSVWEHRVKVRVVGYHDQLPAEELPWAHVMSNPMVASGYGEGYKSHQLEGGESVLGFWFDGSDEQKPVITNVFYKDQFASDTTPNPKGNSYVKPKAKRKFNSDSADGVTKTETGVNDGKKLGTTEGIKGANYTKKGGKFDSVTGRPNSNQNIPAHKGDTIAHKRHQGMLKRCFVPTTCKKDNAVGAITSALGDFTALMYNIEAYGDFYVNSITGAVVNLESELNLVAKKIGGVMTGMTNGVRDSLFSLAEEKIQSFTNALVPEELKPQFGEGLKGVMDTIYCLFGNILNGLKNVIGDFLRGLVGNMINAPLCAVEQMIGSLMGNIMNSITNLISPILNGLSATLGGALGSVKGMIGKALAGVNLLYNFIACDEHKCPLPSQFCNLYGPGKVERDNVNNIMKSIDSISNITDGLPTTGIFEKKGDGSPESIAAIVGGCESNVLRCGPPKIEIFGGNPGLGGLANAVVNEVGQIIGADLLDGGMGYTPENPPYVTFRDSCGDGAGARGHVDIGKDGNIERIIIDSTGHGYMNRYGKVRTIYGDINSDTTSELSNADSKSVTGQIETIEVINAGFDYNPTDTIEAGNACLKPKVLGGRIVGIEVECTGHGFTSIPDIKINSETGFGADLRATLKFTDVSEVSETLDEATEVISVVNCVDKPLMGVNV